MCVIRRPRRGDDRLGRAQYDNNFGPRRRRRRGWYRFSKRLVPGRDVRGGGGGDTVTRGWVAALARVLRNDYDGNDITTCRRRRDGVLWRRLHATSIAFWRADGNVVCTAVVVRY